MSASTLRDLAKMAGVSTATVSRVLNGSQQTSARVRIAVMRAVSTLQYVPNPHAMELARANGGRKRSRHKKGRYGADVQDTLTPEGVIRNVDLPALTSRMLILEKENALLKRTIAELTSESRREDKPKEKLKHRN